MADSEAEIRRKGLPPEAYETMPGEGYPPYIGADEELPELTVRSLTLGIVLGIVFGAANAYLGLRVGLTVSASIPAAVMAVAAFRVLGRGTILEANMVQTIGSAGESLAAGVIFTLPALFIWQRQDPGIVVDVVEISVIALFGGLLGVLFMIPLRSYLISREHGALPYPEGTACAEVQVAGDAGGAKGRLLFGGLGVGALYQLLVNPRALGLWSQSPSVDLPRKAQIGGDLTPELLGVGFIIGPRIAGIMFAGGALAWLLLIPAIDAVGGSDVIYPAAEPMNTLSSPEIWDHYIRYVGAGGVAFGGLITLVKSFPTVVESFRRGLRRAGSAGADVVRRTSRELPTGLVLLLTALLAAALWLWPGIPVDLLGAVLIVVFSFFFVTVSARIVGLIGTSSNPISGMTIAALILTALIFVALGADGSGGMATKVGVLTVGAVVCISAAVAGDTSQDLKTGFLLGATPRRQQVGEMVGVLTSAAVMGWVLVVLSQSYGIGTAGGLPAPQATLMSLVIDGVLEASLPWTFVAVGIVLAAIVEFALRLPSLAFAVGLYLPVSLTSPIVVGGILRWLVERRCEGRDEERRETRERGILYASGLIAGAALLGVAIAGAIYAVTRATGDPESARRWVVGSGWITDLFAGAGDVGPDALGLVVFAGLCALLWRAATGSPGPGETGGAP